MLIGNIEAIVEREKDTMTTVAELQKQIAELEAAQESATALAQISYGVSRARDEDELLQVVVSFGIDYEITEAGLMYVDLDQDGRSGWLVRAAAWQYDDEPAIPIGACIPLSEFPFATSFLDDPNAPLLVSDVATDERVDKDTRDAVTQRGIRAMATIPLTQTGRWLGLVNLSWDEPHEFSEQEKRIYRALVSLASLAVENRRLVDNLERMVAERTAALEEQQAFLRQVIDSTPNLVFVKNREGQFVLANQAVVEAYGTTVDELIGKTEAVFNPNAEEVEQILRADLKVMDSLEEVFIPEEVITDAGGTVRWYQTTRSPLVDDDGVARRVLVVRNEITEQKQMEAERERLQQEIIEAQKQALQELSTPIIPMVDRIIVMPLIGSIDTMRARDITRRLLAGIREHGARVVILDITGVPVVDSGVADHLNKTIQAARLKGARTIVTGISEAVAETIVDLGIDWGGIETLADLESGLIVALSSLGIELTRR
jgi:rsbT co-antagonist protein RsbR